MDKIDRIKKFLTSSVVWYSVIGIILIILGQVEFLSSVINGTWFQKGSAIYPIIKLIGATLLGSGVFTAVIKSTEYTQVFSAVIENIISSKEFISKRTDKKEFWNTVSKLLYEEKFPLISTQLQDIIANHYLPTSSEFYLDNYDLFVNIIDLDQNFWQHKEIVKFTVKPSNFRQSIKYTLKTGIDLPTNLPFGVTDITNYALEEITVNEQVITNAQQKSSTNNNLLSNEINLILQNNEEYSIVIKHTKTLCKKSNPDKRYFAKYITNGLTLTILMPDVQDMIVELYDMGTVNTFVKQKDEVNNKSKILSWTNKGLILPNQGYCIIFKN